jgi:hypothetical protein
MFSVSLQVVGGAELECARPLRVGPRHHGQSVAALSCGKPSMPGADCEVGSAPQAITLHATVKLAITYRFKVTPAPRSA